MQGLGTLPALVLPALLARAPLTPEKVHLRLGAGRRSGHRARDDGDPGRHGPDRPHDRPGVGARSGALARADSVARAAAARSRAGEVDRRRHLNAGLSPAATTDTAPCMTPSSSAPRARPPASSWASLKSLTAPELGAIAVREAVARAGLEPVAGRRVHPGQRRVGRPRPGARAPGGAQGRAARPGRRAHDQQGLRLRAEGRDAGRAGRAPGRCARSSWPAAWSP